MNRLRLAVIGMGVRVTHMAKLMVEADPDARVVAVADPQHAAAAARVAEAGLPDADGVRYFADVESMLAGTDALDGLLIGTQCHLHTPMAVAAARSGLPLFLEKPVAVSWEQWATLAEAYRGREASVLVSFPLRCTAHVRTAVEIIRAGRLGTVNQVQALNNVPYGGVYFGQWYREYEKTGGLWLQKATHDLDYVNAIMDATTPAGARPLAVTAVHSRTVYGGDFAPGHHCQACDVTDRCPESPQNLVLRGDDGGVLNYERPTLASDHACTFSRSILNQDAGSALVTYDNGAHAAYSQNFLPRLTAGQRGATVIGYDATLRFDWQSDTVTVIDHHRPRVDRVQVAAAGNHGGGDGVLARNFIDLVRGREASLCPLTDGLLSAAMCLAARDAAATGVLQALPGVERTRVTPRGAVEPPTRVGLTVGGNALVPSP